MGTVHLAQQVALGREVALKQIHQRSSQKPSVRDEFLTEAVLTGKLEHPNIVPIYEVGESSGGELFYSMKNVKGRAWDETIDELTLDENLEILIDVCDAIAFSHAEGVIHRDLKPHNVSGIICIQCMRSSMCEYVCYAFDFQHLTLCAI